MDEADYGELRDEMVRNQIEARGVTNPRVLEAMREVPRHRFVDEPLRDVAYEDRPLPIGHGQTISQPLVVAWMTELVLTSTTRRALDVGTGCGYQAAVLARIVDEVFSVEVVPELAERASALLDELGYTNVRVRCGDGYEGWSSAAPFDAIVVACAAAELPDALVDQLAPGGHMAIPIGTTRQELQHVEQTPEGEIRVRSAGGVAFVPMVAQQRRDSEWDS